MHLGLNGLVAVITGGTSGIGLATAALFLEEGASVAVCARNAERTAVAVDGLRARFGDRVFGFPADVCDRAAMTAFRAAIVERFGRVDVLVHSAGTSRTATFAATDDEAWRDEIDLKFFGFIHPTRAFLDDLRASGRGSIVCVSALLGIQPEARLAATSATRAGVLNLAKSLSFELAPDGIRVNSVVLGVIDSGQWQRRWIAEREAGSALTREEFMKKVALDRDIPLGRVGSAQEVARAVAFLASPASSYTTGATLEIAGGSGRCV